MATGWFYILGSKIRASPALWAADTTFLHPDILNSVHIKSSWRSSHLVFLVNPLSYCDFFALYFLIFSIVIFKALGFSSHLKSSIFITANIISVLQPHRHLERSAAYIHRRHPVSGGGFPAGGSGAGGQRASTATDMKWQNLHVFLGYLSRVTRRLLRRYL